MVVSQTYSSSTSTSDAAKRSITQNGVESNNSTEVKSSIDHVTLKSLPKGKYTIVGIDIDTTGRRLIDEIVQLAAFTPSDHFSQYIMPYMNLNPAARQRHQVRVISIGFYRMLKSLQTYKIIKSKSEIAALKDFLDWLEALKAKDNSSQGIILVYYEERKFIPYMVLESLKKYNLLDRFLNTVKSFANGIDLAKTNPDKALQHFSLRKLSKHLKDCSSTIKTEPNNNVLVSTATASEAGQASLTDQEKKKLQKHVPNYGREEFDGNARVRAKLTYEVTWQLSNQDSNESVESTNANDKILAALQPHARPIQCDISELQAQNENLQRQNSFRPVFLNYFKTTLYHRVRAVKFRIILAENSYDLQALNDIWSEKKRDGLAEVVQQIDVLKPEEQSELVDLFDSYFDPAKTTIKPVVKTNNRRRNRRVRNVRKNNDENAARSIGDGGDKLPGGNNAVNSPDSTTKFPKYQRTKRNSRPHSAKNLPNILTGTANQTNNATTALVNPTASN